MTLKRNRKETEQKIYEAFIAILEAEGFQKIGINAVARKAGVDKNLIYRYYGGLKGILLRYAKEGDFFEMLTDRHIKSANNKTADFFKAYLIDAIRALRDQPQTQEILRWQLAGNEKHTKELFKFANRQIIAIFNANTPEDKEKQTLYQAAPLMVAGLLYLVLLSKHHRYFMDIDLSNPAGWEKIEAMVAGVIDALE